MQKVINKKIIYLVMILSILVTGSGLNLSKAYAYDKYLNGDTNYVLLYGKQGVSYYLDKSSITVKKQDSEAHAFAQNVVSVADGQINGTKTYWYYQARDSDDDFEAYVSNDGEKWTSFQVNDESGYMQVVVRGFKFGWAEAFGYGWS